MSDFERNNAHGGKFHGEPKPPLAVPSGEPSQQALPDGPWFGCFTGDCPHETQGECDVAIKAYVAELEQQLHHLSLTGAPMPSGEPSQPPSAPLDVERAVALLERLASIGSPDSKYFDADSALLRQIASRLRDSGAPPTSETPDDETREDELAKLRVVVLDTMWRDAESAPRTGEHIIVTQLHGRGFGICGEQWQDFTAVVHWWPVSGEEGFYLSAGASAPIDARTLAALWLALEAESEETT